MIKELTNKEKRERFFKINKKLIDTSYGELTPKEKWLWRKGGRY